MRRREAARDRRKPTSAIAHSSAPDCHTRTPPSAAAATAAVTATVLSLAPMARVNLVHRDAMVAGHNTHTHRHKHSSRQAPDACVRRVCGEPQRPVFSEIKCGWDMRLELTLRRGRPPLGTIGVAFPVAISSQKASGTTHDRTPAPTSRCQHNAPRQSGAAVQQLTRLARVCRASWILFCGRGTTA